MKLDEVIVKQKLDEVPAGGLGQMAKKVGSKVLNKVPSASAKSKAANLAGQADLGDTANNLHKEFNKYLGTQGKKIAQATGEDYVAFLKTKRHQTKATVPSGTLTKQQLNNLLMTASKEAMAGQDAVSAKDKTSTPGQKVKTTTKPSDEEVKKRIPAKLYAALVKLTPEEKKKLAELL